MRRFSIRDVCRILTVKSHVLRYWEQEFPLLAPGKDQSGRRIYSTSDIRLLFRIRFLLYERGYTVEGARKKIWEEVSGRSADIGAAVHSIRMELLEISGRLAALNERISGLDLPKNIPERFEKSFGNPE